MPGKKISDLDIYDDVNSDKSRKNLYEVSKNTGTYASPTYATNGSRKITQEQLREELNIKEYLVRDFIVVGSGGTIVEDKVNAIIVTANETFTLPTASSSNYGKSIVIANRCDYTVTINGIVNGTSIKLTNFNEVIQLSCLFDGVSTYGWWLVSDAINDKICTNRVILNTNTYTAKHNDSIKADALSIGSDVDITIPTAGIEGRLIYVYYPTGSPTAYVVNLIVGFSATLVQLDYFLIRDNGTYWEAISTSQNVAVTPDLDAVTTEGNTTTNDITVGSATVSNTTVSTLPFIDSAKKIISATGALLGTWFQTLTADSNPVDADTIVVNDSTASFEAKKTTLLQLWSNYIKTKADALYATIASLSNYVDLTNPQTISGQKTFSRNTGNSQTGTGTGTVITNLDCSNFIQAGRTYMNVQGTSLSLGIRSGHNGNVYTTVIGVDAGNWSMTGQHNTLIGYGNGANLSSGNVITAVGSGAVDRVTSGTYITALGWGSAYNVTTATNCVYLGHGSGRALGNQSNRLAIDAETFGKSFPFIYGEFDNSVLAFNVNRVGIGVQNPNARAVLHTQSTSRGFLPPVLTTAQRDAVSWVAGDAGMMIYNSTTNKHQGWNGTTWNDMY